MTLDFSAFERAVQSLREVLDAYALSPNAFMRDARNLTSHAYNEHKAQAVFEDIPGFLMRYCSYLSSLKNIMANVYD